MQQFVEPGGESDLKLPQEVETFEKRGRMQALIHAWSDAWQVNAGWLLTGLSLALTEIPLRLLLKNELGLDPQRLAEFILVAQIPIYIKPLAGILVDAIPFFGTRRRHYLLWGLALGALAWLALAMVPRTYVSMVIAYFFVCIFLTLNSTVLGGLMVEVGKEKFITGKLSAQRHGIVRFTEAITGPLAGRLAERPFMQTMGISAFLQMLFWPVVYFYLKEKPTAKVDTEALGAVKGQVRTLLTARDLWAAAGLVILVIAAPGFETPKLYMQQNVLGFDGPFIGDLKFISSVSAVVAAVIYGIACRRIPLRKLLAISILVHAVMTLLYLFYRSKTSAIIIECLESATLVLAFLPLYDLAARATPKGSEALGYSVMMSVWNFTKNFSDFVGASMVTHLKFTFWNMVWVNAFSTLLVLIAVPFLPASLMDRRDGESEAGSVH